MTGRDRTRRALLLAIVFLVGCAGAGDRNAHQFVGYLREVHYDVELYESPKALASAAEAVVVGTIVDVSPGRTIEGIGRHATFVVAVDRVVKGSSDLLSDGKVFVELVTTPVATVEAFRASRPTVRVLLFLDDRTDIPGTGATGAPLGARIFAPWASGMIFEDGDGFLVAYEDLGDMPDKWQLPASFDDLVASLE